ncbi:MAG: DUF1573 domain-containing protein [Bacteroidota bacterium]|nr:DUF1573 domain-containing protein [Bacteroidota bacterium]
MKDHLNISIGSNLKIHGIFLLIGLVFSGCQLTDHSEKGEVTSDQINSPVSGYEDVDPEDLPQIKFNEVHQDMGQMVQGAKVTRKFTFTNTGGSALVLQDVRGSCGCTVSRNWPKHPIKPGEEGMIEVVFDSEGLSGRQNKSVTVIANTSPPSTALTITGEVMGPANMEPIK